MADQHEVAADGERCDSGGPGGTVLVVDDEAAMQEIIRRFFARNGYRVMTAGSGPEALVMAQGYEGDVHLLVTDVHLPQMPGREVAEKMRLIKPGIEIMYTSGYPLSTLVGEGMLDPGVAFVEKPFCEAEMLAMAGQVLDGHSTGHDNGRPR